MKRLNEHTRLQRPNVPIVRMDLSDNEATKRLITHATKRVIQQHKQELEKLAYR